MNKPLVTLALLVLCGAVSGCGTVMRNKAEAQLYPALHVDGLMYSDSRNILNETRDSGPDQAVGQFAAYLGFVLTTLDLPISILTDTVLLPYDLWLKPSKGEQEPNNHKHGTGE